MHDAPDPRQRPARRQRAPVRYTPRPMSNSEPTLQSARQLAGALRGVHRGVLATLAVCAAVIMGQPVVESPMPPPRLSAVAIGLAIATIFLRSLGNSQVMEPKRRVFFALGSLLCAAAIGLLGVAAAWTEGARQIGLGLTLGAAILVLRAPAASREPTQP